MGLASLVGGLVMSVWNFGSSGAYAQLDEPDIPIQSGIVPQDDMPIVDSKKKIIGIVAIVIVFVILIILIIKKRK